MATPIINNIIMSNKNLLLNIFRNSVVAYDNANKINKNYRGPCLNVRRSSDNAELTISFVNGVRDNATLLSFCAGIDGFICKRYDQSGNGKDCTIATAADQQQIVSAGALVSLTAKYFCYEPFASAESLGNNTLAINGRIKNMSSTSYIVYKNSTSSIASGYTADYITPIKCSAGVMDFGITSGTNVYWWLADNTESTASKPAKNMGAGVSYLFATNMAGNIQIAANTTSTRFIGTLKDFTNLTYYLNLLGCGSTTGSLADLQGKITYYLRLANCVLITGSLAGLQGKITYYLGLDNCVLITGSLADLQGKITNYLSISACSLITGSLEDLQGKSLDYININSCTLITGSLVNLTNTVSSILLNSCVLITGSLANLQVSNILSISGCSLISGIYTPTTASKTPTTFTITSSGLSASDVDNTLIACAATPRASVTLTWTGLSRTAASDAAKALLKGAPYNWIFNPDA